MYARLAPFAVIGSVARGNLQSLSLPLKGSAGMSGVWGISSGRQRPFWLNVETVRILTKMRRIMNGPRERINGIL
jgi:hypothetical protein